LKDCSKAYDYADKPLDAIKPDVKFGSKGIRSPAHLPGKS